MAQVSGGAAYQGYRELDNGTSQGLQKWGGIKAQENAAEKLAEERAGVRKQEADEKYDEKFENEWSYEIAGHKDYDDIQKSYVHKTVAQANEYGKLAKAARNSGDRKAQQINETKYNNLRDSFTTFKTLTPIIQERLTAYAENKDDYLASDRRSDINIAMMKNNFLVEPDETGKPKMIIGLDKDKDGVISDEEKQAGQKYIREGFKTKGFEFIEINPSDFGRGAYESFKKVDVLGKEGLIDQLTSTVGITTVDADDPTGNYKVTTTSVTPDKYAQLKKHAETMLSDPQNRANILSNLSILNEDGYIKDHTEYSDKEIEQGVNYLLESAKKKFGFKETTSTNQMTIEDRKKENAAGRAVTMRGQDNAMDRHADSMQMQADRLALAQWKAKNPTKTGKATDNEVITEKSILAYNIAKEIAAADNDDDAVKNITDKYGIDFTTDWNITAWYENEFDIGNKKDLNQKSIHNVASAIANDFGVEYDKMKALSDMEGGTQTSTPTPMTDEEYNKILEEAGN
jgi:hypothetical protein